MHQQHPHVQDASTPPATCTQSHPGTTPTGARDAAWDSGPLLATSTGIHTATTAPMSALNSREQLHQRAQTPLCTNLRQPCGGS